MFEYFLKIRMMNPIKAIYSFREISKLKCLQLDLNVLGIYINDCK